MSEGSYKAHLLDRITNAHEELEHALEELSGDEMTLAGVTGNWSIKDILAHITFWEQRLLDQMAKRLRGEPPAAPETAGNDSSSWVDRLNEENYKRNRSRPLPEVQADFERSYKQVLAAVEALDERAMAPGGALQQLLGYPVDEYMAGDTYDHYPEHTEAIESWRASEEGDSA